MVIIANRSVTMAEFPKEPEEPYFTLPVYTRRHGNTDHYRVWLTKTGWFIAHFIHNGPADPSGQPISDRNFKQDYVDRPVPGVEEAMQSIWEEASAGKLSREEIQSRLNWVGELIEDSERAPRTKSGRKRRR